jgi:hypothetical protein
MRIELVQMIEDMVVQATKFGIFTIQELGEIMTEMICPACTHFKECPVLKGYTLVKEGKQVSKEDFTEIKEDTLNLIERGTKHVKRPGENN